MLIIYQNLDIGSSEKEFMIAKPHAESRVAAHRGRKPNPI